MKWWGRNKTETWAFKSGNDWWLLRPNKKNKATQSQTQKKEQIDWKIFFQSCLFGASIGFAAFCLLLTYLFLKNAF